DGNPILLTCQSTILRDSVLSSERTQGNVPQTHDHLGLLRQDFIPKARVTSLHLIGGWSPVGPRPTQDGVRLVDAPTRKASILKESVQEAASRTYEGLTFFDFCVAGGLPHQHDVGGVGPTTSDDNTLS